MSTIDLRLRIMPFVFLDIKPSILKIRLPVFGVTYLDGICSILSNILHQNDFELSFFIHFLNVSRVEINNKSTTFYTEKQIQQHLNPLIPMIYTTP